MTRTNDHIAGDGKAVDAHERNRNRPDAAKHLPLKDDDNSKAVIATDNEDADDT